MRDLGASLETRVEAATHGGLAVPILAPEHFLEYSEYFDVLSRDEDEFKELMNLVTINETSFFRFPAQFDAFRDTVIPEILDGRSSSAPKQFRVWSAGCSTGEEPYTLAMLLVQLFDETGDLIRELAKLLDTRRKGREKASGGAGFVPTPSCRPRSGQLGVERAGRLVCLANLGRRGFSDGLRWRGRPHHRSRLR